MQDKKTMKGGFSLIEVIIAVAILAILSVPILLYFTNSAIHSANGRYEQAADMAAQSVVEEIDSVNNFDSLETLLVNNGHEWKVLSQAADISGTSKLSRPINVNGNDYVAEVTIDYDAYGPGMPTPAPTATAAPGEPTPTPAVENVAKYNNYKNPHFQDLYSDESVVISEKADCFDVAVNNLYYEFNGNAPGTSTTEKVTIDKVKEKIKRTFKLSVIEYPTGTYNVKGSYAFEANLNAEGGSDASKIKTTEIVLKSTTVDAGKLKNIYFIFMPRYGTEEGSGALVSQNAVIDIDDLMKSDAVNEAKDLGISFIRQNIPGSTETDEANKKNFKITAVSNTDPGAKNNYLNANYYSDIEYGTDGTLVTPYVMLSGVVPGDPSAANANGLMKRTQDKRIALVTVQIYKKDDTSGNVLATNTTTKAI